MSETFCGQHGAKFVLMCPDCNHDLTAKLDEAMKALHDLTPGGSEFVGDIQMCVDFVRTTRSTLMKGLAAEKAKLDEANRKEKADDLTIHTITQRVFDLESGLATANRLLAQGPCGVPGHRNADCVCPWCGSTERFGHLTECQRQKALAINPGALLLARLQAADELAEASAQILRACASSVPGVFSNAQFALGEKLEAYKTAKEAG